TRTKESRGREARLQTGKPGADVVRQEDRAGNRRRHSRGGQGQLGRHVRLDRLEPKREAPQAPSQDRLQAGGISCTSIDGDDGEVPETQSCRCRSTDCCAVKFAYRYTATDSLRQQGCRSEAWRPLSLRWMVCSTWSRSFCIRRAWMAVSPSVGGAPSDQLHQRTPDPGSRQLPPNFFYAEFDGQRDKRVVVKVMGD